MGSLYSLDVDRTLKKQLPDIYLSNGLAWSGDNRTMFYIDSPIKKIYAFDFDVESGSISKLYNMTNCKLQLEILCLDAVIKSPGG